MHLSPFYQNIFLYFIYFLIIASYSIWPADLWSSFCPGIDPTPWSCCLLQSLPPLPCQRCARLSDHLCVPDDLPPVAKSGARCHENMPHLVIAIVDTGRTMSSWINIIFVLNQSHSIYLYMCIYFLCMYVCIYVLFCIYLFNKCYMFIFKRRTEIIYETCVCKPSESLLHVKILHG